MSKSNGCTIKSLGLDEACLQLLNVDGEETREIWSQSSECFKCSPWKYISLPAEEKSWLVVNTTYLTNIFLYDQNKNLLDSVQYHFLQRGNYGITFNSTHIGSISVNQEGDNEYNFAIALVCLILSSLFLRLFGGCCFRRLQDYYQSESVDMNDSQSSMFSDENYENASVEDSTGAIPSFVMEDDDRGIIPDSSTVNTRLQSLDVFRGLSIILMIFVNYGGGKYYFFKHAPWNGLTVADLIFPWFMWIMGVSITFSLKSHLRRSVSYTGLIFRILRRSLALYFLGLIVNSIKNDDIETLRIMGVLQRFAFCYLINALIELFCMSPQDSTEYVRYWPIRDIVWSWMQWMFTGGLILANLLLTFLLNVPGCPRGYLGPGGENAWGKYGNCTGGAAGYIDQMFLTKNHMYAHPSCKYIYNTFVHFEPEGLFGILTSCLTVQFGVAAGRIVLYFPRHWPRIKRWLIWGIVLGILGGLLCGWKKEDGWIPINKNLWSLSYVCVTASFAFFLLSFLYYTIDVRQWWSAGFLRKAGLNAILLYVGHEITKNLFPWSWTPIEPFHKNHLLRDLWGVFLWVLIAILLDRKRLYFSV